MKIKIYLINQSQVALSIVLFFVFLSSQKIKAQNDVMMQSFYWNVPVDEINHHGTWWDILSGKADILKNAGITAIWVPCPSKGNWGITDMGYGIYDHYDLGNYNQKGSTETRFGSRLALTKMINKMHDSPYINVYADVVLNHVYSNDTNDEINPAVKDYTFGEAHNGSNVAYPTNEIKWVIPNALAGDYFIQIKGYNVNWLGSIGERGYDVNINWTGDPEVDKGEWESEPNNGNGVFNVFPGSGHTLRGHADYPSDIDEFKITLSTTHDIIIKLTAKKEQNSPWAWIWADQTNGYYPFAVWNNGINLAKDTLQAHTNTSISYINHTGTGEPNYYWNYSHFHPSDSNDWLGSAGNDDEVIPNTKLFGNDFNTYDDVVKTRLKNWGSWLADQMGFDGFRLDFVRGFQEEFVSDWVNNLPSLNGNQRFIVGEYWGKASRIKSWVNTVGKGKANVTAFDFPLHNSLKDLCNGNGSNYNMSWLNHAGLVRDNNGNDLPDNSVVTFLDNHDTGKEHDKWISKDHQLGYAYMLTHQAKPCIFYPHYFGVKQQDQNDPNISTTASPQLQTDINNLIKIRKNYLGGKINVLSETGNPYPSSDTYNVYIARRQGNGTLGGAIIVLNNNDNQTKGLWVDTSPTGFDNWAGATLVNALNGTDTVTVFSDGRAYFSAPARGYTIWVNNNDYQSLHPQMIVSLNQDVVKDEIKNEDLSIYPNPAKEILDIRVSNTKSTIVQINILNAEGRLVQKLYNGKLKIGDSSFKWKTGSHAAGIYYCIIYKDNNILKKRFVIIK